MEIKAAHQRTRETCGPERLQHELKEQGVKVGICRIRRIRKKLGIRCKQKTAYEIGVRLVGSEMCIRDRHEGASRGSSEAGNGRRIQHTGCLLYTSDAADE